LTESNFTLGALSPESAELIGQLDPVLGSIVAARQTVQESTSALNFGSLLSDGASAGSSGEESIGDLDLGFYFDSQNNRAHEEIENDADDEEEEELVNLIRPESSASNTIDAHYRYRPISTNISTRLSRTCRIFLLPARTVRSLCV
jgi:hypothetical protein